MDFIKRRGALLVFVAVLGLCGVWISWSCVSPKDTDAEKSLGSSRQSIDAALKSPIAGSDYAYSPAQASKLNHAAVLKGNATRAASANEAVGTFVSFPQPSRPKSSEIIRRTDRHIYAEIGAFKALFAHATQGRVYLSCDIPRRDDMKMMEPVRIEIFRGLDDDKIDTAKPYAVIELSLEEPIIKPPVAPVDNTKEKGKKPLEAFKLPETLRAYCDTTVEPTTTYYYQSRLVSRFTSAEGRAQIISTNETVTNPDGSTEVKAFNYAIINHGPQFTSRVAPANPASSTELYATALTPVVRAATPTNFVLRLAGINGEVPNEIRKPGEVRMGYSARFEVRAWISELQDWKTAQLGEVGEGNVLSGKITYKPKRSTQNKEYDFTSILRYRLLELNKEKSDEQAKMPTVVATLENQRTGKKELLSVSRFPPPDPNQNELDKVIDAQNREMIKKRGELPPAK